MRQINKLTQLKLATLAKPGRYSDGLGLYLDITNEGNKAWCYRYMMAGKARQLGLGPLHSVSLQEARNRAREARQLILDGKDPIAVRQAMLAEERVATLRTVTFIEAANQFLSTEKIDSFKNPKHRAQWRSTLESYAFPVIGNLPLQSIDSAVVLQCLLPVWKRVPETGSRLRGRIERVFAWAKAHKLFDGENPASRDVLQDALPAKPKAKHHAALPYADLPAFFAAVAVRDDHVSAQCLAFTILTATRTQEAIGARWSEIDLDAATWTIPASRMKAKRDHRVPLSDRAVEILRGLNRLETKEFIFINGGGKPLSNMAMSELLKGMIPPERATVHGFRSTFSDWARDQTSYPRDVIEMCLAHSIRDKSEAAYRRGDALDKRRRLMTEWSRYCETPAATGATVTRIGKAS